MPTIGPFGRDEVATRLHGALQQKFEEAIENEGFEVSNEARQKITMMFCNEVNAEWVQKRLTTMGMEHRVARAMVLGVMREWLGDPQLKSLFKAYGKKDMWNVR